MGKREWCLLVLGFIFIIAGFGFVNAFQWNGTVYDVFGISLNDTIINVSVRNSQFTVIGYNYTRTNATGWFNLTVDEVSGGFYQPTITHNNASLIPSPVDFVGQNLPAFPSDLLQLVAGTSFYLREGGTVNITAINSTGGKVNFRYQIKDTKLGYPIADDFQNYVSEVRVYLPRDRNYSIMIYPNASMPVSFSWDNFTSANTYNLGVNSVSKYNATTRTLHYQFNTTIVSARVSGYINYSSVGGWDEFTVVPYLMEPGSIVHASFGDMPYNLTAFFNAGFQNLSDIHNRSSGFYNITLPSTPAETSNILLFATARNGSKYYGGFRNISSLGSTGLSQFNFSAISGLFGAASNITMDTITGITINVSTAKHTFRIVNSTNSTFDGVNAHIETVVDYSSLGAVEFTWMEDIDQGTSSVFYLPLLNNTGIKEMNVYVSGGNYAPKKISKTVSQIISDNNNNANATNISIGRFEGAAIGGTTHSGLEMTLYISNSTCDVPSPPGACVVGGSGQANQGFSSFNPMKAIIGGGKLSFRMRISSTDVKVHYVNVDMLASGPPDALFDSSSTEANTSTSFSSAARFGSLGPSIFDYALVSIPYTQGSSSTTGLNESANVYLNTTILYDDNWNPIWNVSANGTAIGALVGNYSYYSARQTEWQYLLNGTLCHTNATSINITNPCYKDTGDNDVWARIPHFTGTLDPLTGNVILATDSGTTTGGAASAGTTGGGNATSYWINTYTVTDAQFQAGYNKSLLERERLKIKIEGQDHYVGIVDIDPTSVKINVSSHMQQAKFDVGERKKFEVTDDNYYDLAVTLNSITQPKASITVEAIQELLPDATGNVTGPGTNATGTGGPISGKVGWFVVGIFVIIILAVGGFLLWKWYEKRKRLHGLKS